MHNELLIPKSATERDDFISADETLDQAIPIVDLRQSRVDPFEHPACRVVLGGAQIGFDALSYRPASVPLGGAVSFGIGFAQRYSHHGRAGQALLETGITTAIDLGRGLFINFAGVPFSIRAMTYIVGSLSVYARDQLMDEHSFNLWNLFHRYKCGYFSFTRIVCVRSAN